jgi:hypothetical protein
MVLQVNRCHDNLQDMSCTTSWEEQEYRFGECIACVMDEPAGQASPLSESYDPWSPALESDFCGHSRLRDCRFPEVDGCRWHDGFPRRGSESLRLADSAGMKVGTKP